MHKFSTQACGKNGILQLNGNSITCRDKEIYRLDSIINQTALRLLSNRINAVEMNIQKKKNSTE